MEGSLAVLYAIYTGAVLDLSSNTSHRNQLSSCKRPETGGMNLPL